MQALAWGKENEEDALARYSAKSNVTVRKCGFIVDPRCCWLGASPDGIVCDSQENEDGLVEIKCPYSQRNG